MPSETPLPTTADTVIRSFSDPAATEFRHEIRTWLERVLPPDWRKIELSLTEDREIDIRRQWDRTLFEAGYAGLSWPKRFGGGEAGPIKEVIFYEELARAHAPEGFGRVGRVMAGPLIMRFGTEDQQRRFLPAILDGSQVWCLGYSEPSAGSDLAAATTTALRDGDVYRVVGRKIWTSHAHISDRCVLLARTAPERPRHENMSILLLDMHQPGVDLTPLITITGHHHFNEVAFDGAVVSVADRLGPEHEGWNIFRESLAFERGAAVALNHYTEMCRECEVLLQCCALHSPDPGVASSARTLADQVELVRWHILRVTEMEANDLDATEARMVMKLFWSELWQAITDFGSRISCSHHRAFWRYQYLQSRAATIYGGTSEIQRSTIGRRALAVLAPS